ncbi:uncharacterized protein rab11fip1a isoform X2 [Festucalex cinctus]
MSLADQSQQSFPTSVQVTVHQARYLRPKGKNGTNDAYAIIQVAKDKFSTAVAEKSTAPMWREEATFALPLFHPGNVDRCTLYIIVMHRVQAGLDKFLGQAVVNLVELHENKSRQKPDWFPLVDKNGKADKLRGDVLLGITFMRNNMSASMVDLSMKDKPRSRMSKFKDKVRMKKKDSFSDSGSAMSQVLTDSEGDRDSLSSNQTSGEKKKSSKLKNLFAPKSNLHRNSSQSMSTLGTLPGRNSSLSGSRSSGINVETPEVKKKFKFLGHKRSGSSDSKVSLGPLSILSRSKHSKSDLNNPSMNSTHMNAEEAEPRSGSTLSLNSSGQGSMENVHQHTTNVTADRHVPLFRSETRDRLMMEQQRRQVEEERRQTEDVRLQEEEDRQKRWLEEENLRKADEYERNRQFLEDEARREKQREEEEEERRKRQEATENEERRRMEELTQKNEEHKSHEETSMTERLSSLFGIMRKKEEAPQQPEEVILRDSHYDTRDPQDFKVSDPFENISLGSTTQFNSYESPPHEQQSSLTPQSSADTLFPNRNPRVSTVKPRLSHSLESESSEHLQSDYPVDQQWSSTGATESTLSRVPYDSPDTFSNLHSSLAPLRFRGSPSASPSRSPSGSLSRSPRGSLSRSPRGSPSTSPPGSKYRSPPSSPSGIRPGSPSGIWPGSQYKSPHGSPSRSPPGSPSRSPPGSQYRSLTGSQYRSPPGSPTRIQPGSLSRSPPGSEYRSLTSSQYRSPPGSPTRIQPGSPSRSPPGSEYRSLTSSQYRSPPSSPTRIQPGSPSRSPPGSEYRSLTSSQYRSSPGSPTRIQPGSPSRSPPGSPNRSPLHSPSRSPPPSPSRSPPPSPSRSPPGSQYRSPPDSLSKSPPGSPSSSAPGIHYRSPPGSPSRSRPASPSESLPSSPSYSGDNLSSSPTMADRTGRAPLPPLYPIYEAQSGGTGEVQVLRQPNGSQQAKKLSLPLPDYETLYPQKRHGVQGHTRWDHIIAEVNQRHMDNTPELIGPEMSVDGPGNPGEAGLSFPDESASVGHLQTHQQESRRRSSKKVSAPPPPKQMHSRSSSDSDQRESQNSGWNNESLTRSLSRSNSDTDWDSATSADQTKPLNTSDIEVPTARPRQKSSMKEPTEQHDLHSKHLVVPQKPARTSDDLYTRVAQREQIPENLGMTADDLDQIFSDEKAASPFSSLNGYDTSKREDEDQQISPVFQRKNSSRRISSPPSRSNSLKASKKEPSEEEKTSKSQQELSTSDVVIDSITQRHPADGKAQVHLSDGEDPFASDPFPASSAFPFSEPLPVVMEEPSSQAEVLSARKKPKRALMPPSESLLVSPQISNGGGFDSTLSRPHPVKPMHTIESQYPTSTSALKDMHLHSGKAGKVKVAGMADSGPFTQLTHEELITLVVRQQADLSKKDCKISELEEYIDNLLVRVIEEKPAILQAMNATKPA